jgi:hypothetical protein
LNTPEHPDWGGWGGRLGHQERFPGKAYFWANQRDAWNGSTNRDNTLLRWAADLQNDFRARLDACRPPPQAANRPPGVHLDGPERLTLVAGERRTLRASASRDPDGTALTFEWFPYPEADPDPDPDSETAPRNTRAPLLLEPRGAELAITAPRVDHPETHHLLLRVTDAGEPTPSAATPGCWSTSSPQPSRSIASPTSSTPRPNTPHPPTPCDRRSASTTGARSPAPKTGLRDGRNSTRTGTASWARGRRSSIAPRSRFSGRNAPPAKPTSDAGFASRSPPARPGKAGLLLPDHPGPLPAVLVVYYEPETSLGLNPKQTLRDFGLQLARRGFVTLSIGTPGGNAWKPDLGSAPCQPLSFHAYVAANAWLALAALPQVDPARIGITGHSYGGKWALFAAAWWERFAAVAVSDPGIVFDETRPNVNYWEPWYLGLDPQVTRRPGLTAPDNPRTGAYAQLVAEGRDLHEIHALLAPRPFLVSGGAEDPPERWRALHHLLAIHRLLGTSNRVAYSSRPTHDPTPKSNDQLYAFFEHFLRPPRP